MAAKMTGLCLMVEAVQRHVVVGVGDVRVAGGVVVHGGIHEDGARVKTLWHPQ